MENTSTMNLLDVGSKCQTKYELYQTLVVEGNLFLPPIRDCKIEFISDIMTGKKKTFLNNQVIVKTVPQIEGLMSINLIEYIVETCKAEVYLPDNYMKRHPCRTWLGNLCNLNIITAIGHSLDPEGFTRYISYCMKERQNKLLKKGTLTLDVQSNFVDIFKNSDNISTRRGRAHLLLNQSKKQERLAKKRAVEEEEKLMKDQMQSMADEIEALKNQLDKNKEELEEGDYNREILRKLFDDNVIDREGNILK